MKTVIVTGGSVEEDFALELLKREEPDLIIAVDHGLDFLDRVHIMPQEIVGDFDSAKPGMYEKYVAAQETHIQRFCPQKDNTDTEIAIDLAIQKGSSQVIILGGTGTRLDHVLGTITCLGKLMEAGIPACVMDSHNRISMIRGGANIKKQNQFGKYVSLIPVGGEVKGLSLFGFAYPLKDFTLKPFSSRCISNELREETGEIVFTTGTLLVIESRDESYHF